MRWSWSGMIKVSATDCRDDKATLSRIQPNSLRCSQFDLVPAAPRKSPPLATFQSGRWWDRGDVVIHPRAITHSATSGKGKSKSAETKPPQHSLLHNGEPTRLLDLALVAEAIYKTNLCQSVCAGVAAAAAAEALVKASVAADASTTSTASLAIANATAAPSTSTIAPRSNCCHCSARSATV